MDTSAARPWWFVILIGRDPKRTFARVLVLVAFCLFCWKYVVVPIRVVGISMLPTYRERDIGIINRLSYRFGEPQRGDVVAIRMAGEHVMLLKRIVGLPGETLSFRGGQLFIDDLPVAEPYVKLPCNWNLGPIPIANDEYYFVGDNRSMNELDHTKGRTKREKIVGKKLL